MPLIKSGSKAAREKNIKKEIAAGKDPKQAVAIAYATQRAAKKDDKKEKKKSYPLPQSRFKRTSSEDY